VAKKEEKKEVKQVGKKRPASKTPEKVAAKAPATKRAKTAEAS
jgi:hypothetical protein